MSDEPALDPGELERILTALYSRRLFARQAIENERRGGGPTEKQALLEVQIADLDSTAAALGGRPSVHGYGAIDIATAPGVVPVPIRNLTDAQRNLIIDVLGAEKELVGQLHAEHAPAEVLADAMAILELYQHTIEKLRMPDA